MNRLFYFFICFSCFSYAQKEYEFDYLLEYEYQSKKKNELKTSRYYYLTNSKDNTYIVQLNNKDSITFTVGFVNYDKFIANVMFKKIGLLQSEKLVIPCQYVRKKEEAKYGRSLKYGINVLNDTLVDGIMCSMYELRLLNKKIEKRKKLSRMIYLIDKNTVFHKSMIDNYYRTSDNELQKIPNGILLNRILLSYDGKIIKEEKLISYVKINKKVVLMEDCE